MAYIGDPIARAVAEAQKPAGAGMAELDAAGLVPKDVPVNMPPPRVAPPVTRVPLPVARTGLGMVPKMGLAGLGLALAPGAGGAIGYGLGAAQTGQDVLPAMGEGFKAGYGIAKSALGL